MFDFQTRHDCSICNKTFVNESLLTVHYQLIHAVTHSIKLESIDNSTDTVNYPCDKCNRSFKNPSSMLYHKNSEHNHFRFVCSKCGKSFKHKQLLRRHQLVHSQDRKLMMLILIRSSINFDLRLKDRLRVPLAALRSKPNRIYSIICRYTIRSKVTPATYAVKRLLIRRGFSIEVVDVFVVKIISLLFV